MIEYIEFSNQNSFRRYIFFKLDIFVYNPQIFKKNLLMLIAIKENGKRACKALKKLKKYKGSSILILLTYIEFLIKTLSTDIYFQN